MSVIGVEYLNIDPKSLVITFYAFVVVGNRESLWLREFPLTGKFPA